MRMEANCSPCCRLAQSTAKLRIMPWAPVYSTSLGQTGHKGELCHQVGYAPLGKHMPLDMCCLDHLLSSSSPVDNIPLVAGQNLAHCAAWAFGSKAHRILGWWQEQCQRECDPIFSPGRSSFVHHVPALVCALRKLSRPDQDACIRFRSLIAALSSLLYGLNGRIKTSICVIITICTVCDTKVPFLSHISIHHGMGRSMT